MATAAADSIILPSSSLSPESIITGVGQEFDNVKDLRAKLFQYAMRKGFAYKFVKSELTRVTVKCIVENCPWRLHASKSSYKQKIIIKILNNEHTCGCGGGGDVQPKATKKWLVDIIKDKLRDSPLYKTKEILKDVSEEYGINLKYYQVWRGKTDAQKELLNLHEEAYNQLPIFCEKILESNPGSVVTLATSADLKFRIFVSFHASLRGFEYGCRPLIFLDRIPLKENTHLKLLAAASVDGDDGIFPVAFAAVEAETPESWIWFLEQLKFAVGTSRTITFISDRENGLEVAVPKVFEDSFHSFCLLHLVEDFKAELNRGPWSQGVKDAMVEELERAAQTYHAEEFYARVECVKNISEEAAAWILASKPEHWSGALFKGSRYDHCSSDAVESFSTWIPVDREMSVVLMIDAMRCKITEAIDARRQSAAKWEDALTPSMEQRLHKEKARAGKLGVLRSSENVFEVRGSSINVINTGTWECTCGRWQVSGLPCVHAIAVINHLGRSIYDYCSQYFRVESYRAAYSESVYPIPDVEKISSSFGANIPAPRNRRPRGVLKQVRDRSQGGRGHHCSRCKGSGHNKATCKALL